MSVAAVALAIIQALGLIAACSAAATFGYKYGESRGDLKIAQDAAAKAIRDAGLAEISANERIRREVLVIADLKAKIRGLREELSNHPDPTVRASVALGGIFSLLSDTEGDNDADPGTDNDAGPVPPV